MKFFLMYFDRALDSKHKGKLLKPQVDKFSFNVLIDRFVLFKHRSVGLIVFQVVLHSRKKPWSCSKDLSVC